jgi:hypothetical protein
VSSAVLRPAVLSASTLNPSIAPACVLPVQGGEVQPLDGAFVTSRGYVAAPCIMQGVIYSRRQAVTDRSPATDIQDEERAWLVLTSTS